MRDNLNKKRWVWVVRYPSTNGRTSQCESVGYFCPPGDDLRALSLYPHEDIEAVDRLCQSVQFAGGGPRELAFALRRMWG